MSTMKIYSIFLMVSVMPPLATTDASNLALICNETLSIHLNIQMSKVRLLKIFQNDTDIAIGSFDGKQGNWSTSSEHKGRLSFGTTENGIKILLNNISSSATYKCVITFNTGTFTVTDWNVILYEKDTLNKTIEITLQMKEPISREFICGQKQVDCYVLDESFTCIQQPTTNTIYTENDNNQAPLIVAVTIAATTILIGAVCLICCYLRKRKQKQKSDSENEDELNQTKAKYYCYQDDDNGSIHLKDNPTCPNNQPLMKENNE